MVGFGACSCDRLRVITGPARRAVVWTRAARQPAYLYYWTYVPDGPNGGSAHHACEQPFVFHVKEESPAEAAEDSEHYHFNAKNPFEMDLSTQLVQMYANMADQGSPGTSWPVYNMGEKMTMIFGDDRPTHAGPTYTLSNHRGEKCDFWDRQFDRVMADYTTTRNPGGGR